MEKFYSGKLGFGDRLLASQRRKKRPTWSQATKKMEKRKLGLSGHSLWYDMNSDVPQAATTTAPRSYGPHPGRRQLGQG